MKRTYVLCLSALIFAAGTIVFQPSTSAQKIDKFKRSANPIANRYIVVLQDDNVDVSGQDVADVANTLTSEYAGTTDKVYRDAIQGYSVEMTPEVAEKLSGDARVKYVEEDSYLSAAGTESNPYWALDRIDQHALPYDLTYNYSAAGTGVNVYVIDSGILTTHVELAGRAFDAYSTIRDTTPISQCNGHGTGVAGVIGSSTFGVAKNVKLYSVRVLPCTGYGTVSDGISGIDWVTHHAVHPAVANVSLGANLSPTLNDAVAASVASGVIYAIAAGNETDDACSHSPSSVLSAITVAGSDPADQRVPSSNFGPCVDVFAPGQGVATIWNTTNTTTTYPSGTSFASPYVAGVAALYLETHPAASPAEVQNAITDNATHDMVIDPGLGSPNMLLYSIMSGTVGGCQGVSMSGSLAGSGSMDYQSSSLGFAGGGGAYSGSLQLPTGLSANLTLQKQGGTKWSTVASSSGGSGVQTLNYNGRSGTYRWRIASVSGGGSYSLCTAHP